jgi:hypothetical protein
MTVGIPKTQPFLANCLRQRSIFDLPSTLIPHEEFDEAVIPMAMAV